MGFAEEDALVAEDEHVPTKGGAAGCWVDLLCVGLDFDLGVESGVRDGKVLDCDRIDALVEAFGEAPVHEVFDEHSPYRFSVGGVANSRSLHIVHVGLSLCAFIFASGHMPLSVNLC